MEQVRGIVFLLQRGEPLVVLAECRLKPRVALVVHHEIGVGAGEIERVRDMRRNLDPTPMPDRRCVIHFIYPEQPTARRYWRLVIEPDADVDLCSVDPGFDVDLYVTVDLLTMTAIWMGLTNVADSVAKGKLTLTGDRGLARDMQAWLGLSPFATEKKLVRA
jgi:hypothetical protein